MSTATPPARIVYPETDGQPMAENTLQFRWIMTIVGGLQAAFAARPDVFVAGDLFWYPVEGDPKTRMAPDALVALGRPKGERSSYLQWAEGGVAPQVVFEILSPSNRFAEMKRKFEFYERFGVEEYYIYDPDDIALEGWVRRGERLEEIPQIDGWVSPRLGIRFDLTGPELVICGPDGRRFATYEELDAERRRAEHERDRAAAERDRLAAKLRALGIDPEA